VFRAFLRLGCTSFGGPIAHLGYFRAELVERRRWIDDAGYADLVGLCQFLPGPASSQVGFALGLIRAGWPGGLAAWAGFTLPSAVLMAAFALLARRLPLAGLAHGLALVAVAVVAQAVWSMARALCPDRERASIAVGACAAALLLPAGWAQIGAIALAGVAGLALPRPADPGGRDAPPAAPPVPAAIACLGLFAVLLALSLLLPTRFAAAFYRSGALVFGGGHVVLPLLSDAVVLPGWVPRASFLTGYGATQAMPGPLFTFAAYLGAVIAGWRGAIVALVAIFLPGLLLVAGALPFWARLRRRPAAVAALRGVNAAVVGLLAAALYDPVWTSGVRGPADFVMALTGFALLTAWRVPPVVVVALGVAAGLAGAPG
jgi:chromate transporter